MSNTVPVAEDGVALLIGAILLLVLSWIIFSMRIGVRIWRKAFGMDDWLMLVGSVRIPSQAHGETDDLTLHCRFCSQLPQRCALSAAIMVLDSTPVICLH
jgi:hypothetical protein